MKRLSIVLLTIIFLVLFIQPGQAVDYRSLKNEYIKNHPGQDIIPYPWEPTSSIKVLPINYEIPAVPGNTIIITACPEQFEAASFIITAQKDLSGITISVPNLYDTHGNTIPSNAFDIRTVKVWYQGDPTDVNMWDGREMHAVLVPELLLKNDSLVRVNYTRERNEVWLKNSTFEGYFPLDNTTIGQFPNNAVIVDNGTATGDIRPFALRASENKQIWMTIHVPARQAAGNYSGTITLSSPLSSPVMMTISVRVLPFTLEDSTLKYGLVYHGYLPSPIPSTYTIDGEKTRNQYTAELQDMKDHGVHYPTFFNWAGNRLEESLSLRDTMGFPKDMIFLGNGNPPIGNATNPAGLATIASTVTAYCNHTETYGYQNTYFYGMDEETGTPLASQRTAWNTVHSNGGKMWVASYISGDLITSVGDILDVANIGYEINSTEVHLWHNYGHKVFSYNNPQVGVENPDSYRKNYGFALWNAGYDGTMNFAYQAKYGQSSWNDFDTTPDEGPYRDHLFAYPASNGVIDTIEWEGWREGVDDTRYLATLIKLEGSDSSAKAIVADSLSKGEDMATIREKIIEQILITLPSTPKQPTIGIYSNGVWYIDANADGIWNTGDEYHTFGSPFVQAVTGDWNHDGNDEIGVFLNGGWWLDANGDGIWNTGDEYHTFGSPGVQAVTGDWNHDGNDEIGVFLNGGWWLDTNGSGAWDTGDEYHTFGSPGVQAVTGDWNHDGKDEIGVFLNGGWWLDTNGDGIWDTGDEYHMFGSPGVQAVTGDWNHDGIDEIGVFYNGEWWLDTNGDGIWNSGDEYHMFGSQGVQAVTGDWKRVP